jgi:hypothetical protein
MGEISALELDPLWKEFHDAVNMTSQELAAWLRVDEAAGADAAGEGQPDRAGADVGERVLSILQKRRTDLTDDDIRVMYQVVETVEEKRGGDAGSGADDQRWRHQLMRMGHDPLKEA